jgi:thiosulfate dehydrogenase
MNRLICTFAAATGLLGLVSCSSPPPKNASAPSYPLAGPLIPARMTMSTAWDVPDNPLTETDLPDSKLRQEIRWGYRLFTNTPAEAARFVPSRVTCSNCHLNAGQRERAMPLVAIAGAFPEYNRRAGRLITLGDRIVDCFLRSENATGKLPAEAGGHSRAIGGDILPTPTSKEVLALSAYLTWLSRGYAIGANSTWRGQNSLAAETLIPIDRLEPEKGAAIFAERCVSCHGPDGQGVFVGDKRPGPLWGPESWNDGAGASRVYTLAGIIRYTMPYLDPGSLTDEESQQLAAFITSQPRPSYPFKDEDYQVDPLPDDAVYYPSRSMSR